MNDEPTQSRPLPHHERHRRTLLATIARESAHKLAPGRALSGTKPSRGRSWLTPAIAIVAVLIVVAAGIGVHALLRPAIRSSAGPTAVGGSVDRSATQKYTVPGPVANLIVNDTTGSVAVTAGSGSEVSVTAKIFYRTKEPSISHTISRQTLTLGSPACADCGVAFTVAVPRATSATINEHTGKVIVAGLAGDVSVSDDTGMVTITNLSGDVSVNDGSGAISGTSLTAARATFRDRNGMIEVMFGAPPQQLIAVSGIGMVSVQVPPTTTYRVNASSHLGTVHDSVPRSPIATHVITATSNTGMVFVGISSLAGP